MKKFFQLLSLAGILLLSGCGYFDSGKWVDDSSNWKRAFKSDPPSGFEILHSSFMKTPHWTYEFEYFFVLQGNEPTRQALFANDQLLAVTPLSPEFLILDGSFQSKPSWFLPKPLDQYEIWIFKDEPRQHFRLYRDKISGNFYLTDNQI